MSSKSSDDMNWNISMKYGMEIHVGPYLKIGKEKKKKYGSSH